MREYQLVSPSLDGILYHDSVVYEGIKRPTELSQFMDGPLSRGRRAPNIPGQVYSDQDLKVIREYLGDLHRLFMKKFSQFMIDTELKSDEDVKLQALLQEMIKIKKLI